MNSNPNVEKLVHITEEVQKPIHVPIFLGNECFIVTQQDMRKIENIRLLTYSKLSPNGDLIPSELLGHESHTRDTILNACKYCIEANQNTGHSDIKMLAQLLNMLYAPQPMDISMAAWQPTPPVATIHQQMQWDKITNSSPFPFSATKATSTDDGRFSSHRSKSSACTRCSNCGNKTCSRGSNTIDDDDDDDDDSKKVDGDETSASAREQLKKKKLCQGLSCLGIS